MANCTSTALAPKTAAIGNASSTLELLNELVKQGAIVIQNATILQDVTVNHSNISVASKDCHQTITTHCMGEKQMEVEQTICPAGHEVTTSNEEKKSRWTMPFGKKTAGKEEKKKGGFGLGSLMKNALGGKNSGTFPATEVGEKEERDV